MTKIMLCSLSPVITYIFFVIKLFCYLLNIFKAYLEVLSMLTLFRVSIQRVVSKLSVLPILVLITVCNYDSMLQVFSDFTM